MRSQASRSAHPDSADLADISTGVAGHAGLLGTITFRQLAGPAAACITLWDSEASAAGFPGPVPG